MRRRPPRTVEFSLLCGTLLVSAASADEPEHRSDNSASRFAEERALFAKEWVPGVPSPRGGDGLGPVYNDTSCVACHHQGGIGGAGPKNKNVDLLTAAVTVDQQGEKPPEAQARSEDPQWDELFKLHGGFRSSTSVRLHRFGTEPSYELWRLFVLDPRLGVWPADASRPSLHLLVGLTPLDAALLTAKMSMNRAAASNPVEYGDFTLFRFQRSPPPLFGLGLIDAIPDEAIDAALRNRPVGFPEIRGRPARLDRDRMGRFGWKAQTAKLEEFVRAACALELGLEVPGRHQAEDPRRPSYRAPGLDLTRAECDALVAFVRALPPPVEHAEEGAAASAGKNMFKRIGCSCCHAEQLATVKGIYSDFLLHDMGDDLADNGSYSVPLADATSVRHGPSRREWRTAPLWGLRESAPYLHDGRAETLEQAIALHGGEAEPTARRFFDLPELERRWLLAFLKSLRAP